MFLVNANQDPEHCVVERTLKPKHHLYSVFIQLNLWHNWSFLYLLVDLLKDFWWIVLYIALSTRKWARVIVSRSNLKHHSCGISENDWGPPENQSFETGWYTFEKLVSWFEGDPELVLVWSEASISTTRFRWAYFCIFKTNKIFSQLHKHVFCVCKRNFKKLFWIVFCKILAWQ